MLNHSAGVDAIMVPALSAHLAACLLRSADGVARGSAGRIRVLVVEDEWLVSTEIEAVLREAGYEVVGIATSADEAVEFTARLDPHVVLMDVRLKGVRDGVEAALEIARRFGKRCLFTTAHADPRTRERAQPSNPAAWLSKPFSGAQLVAALRSAIEEL